MKIILIGGGEHARVVGEAIQSKDAADELIGFVDQQACAETIARLNVPRLGDDNALASHSDTLGLIAFGDVGSTGRRRDTVERLSPRLAGWAIVVHGTAVVSPTATIGEGTVIMAGAVIQSGARIGRHCIVNTRAVVEHDVQVGDYAQLAPGSVVGGGADIGEGAYIGLGASVRDHVRVGANATVGMGAAVVSDVEAGKQVTGVPAR